MNLVERVHGKLTEITKASSTSIKGQQQFNEQLESAIQNLIQNTVKTATNRKYDGMDEYSIYEKILEDTEKNSLSSGMKAAKEDRFSVFMSEYGKIYNQNKNYREALQEVGKMDFWEKFRAFILRICTAIGIAAIVLATSYLAQRWGIPLPLRMGAIMTS